LEFQGIWKQTKDSTVRSLKKEAVDYYLSTDKSAEEVARDLGIPYSNLKRWHTQYQKPG